VSSTETFGARYHQLQSAQQRLDFETAESRREAFANVDAVLDGVVLAALHGERVIDITPGGKRQPDEVLLRLPPGTDRLVLAEHFSVEQQQSRGAWYVPSTDNLAVGVIHLAHWWQTNRRFAVTLVDAEHAKPRFEHADAVTIWAVLEPLFEELYLPLKLRSGRWAGQKTGEKQLPYWAGTIEPLYEALGLSDDGVLLFRPGTGWAELDADEVLNRRDSLIGPWGRADIETARRLRSYRIGQLVERYYSKAKDGRAQRRRVMNKVFERTLSAYFGGDWLALLAYLGEEPDAGEEITQSLPEPHLMVASSARTSTVAAAHGLAAEEVERMLAAYWHQSGGVSPVEQRVHALEVLWHEFDIVHARQAPGMPSLRGLMLQNRLRAVDWPLHPDYQPGAELKLLSGDLQADLQRLWSTKLSRWPERLVTEPLWALAAARALGPAFDFWHELALTLWSICEGGSYARTDLEGLEADRPEWQEALDELGCPISRQLFAELRAAESKLGPEEETWDNVQTTGFVTMQTGHGSRRDGFEIVRDIVTRHRRAWAQQYLGPYLQARWRTELHHTGREYSRFAADKAKAPTVKQFAKMARDPAVHWFGGDLTGVYGVLGLRALLEPPTYSRMLPIDFRGFVKQVFTELGGQPTLRATTSSDSDEREKQELELERSRIRSLDELASESLAWVEAAEGLGRPPELKEFGQRKFEYHAAAISEDIDEAWREYSAAIQRSLAAPTAAAAAPAGPKTVAGNGTQRPTRKPRPETDASGREAVHSPPASIQDSVPEPSRRRSFLDRLRGR
jgi:hypothetical protein